MERFRVRAVALIAAGLIGSGCFSYIPADLETLPPGENVRLWVTGAATLQLTDFIPIGASTIRGELLEQRDTDVFLSVAVGRRQEGFHSPAFYQNVPIPVSEIVQVERREFNKTKTGALALGTVGGAAVVLGLILKAFNSFDDSEECTGEDCPEFLMFSIPIPLP